MIQENINPNWKRVLARGGDARVFGERSDVRRHMDDEEAVAHFDKVWAEKLEEEVRRAPVISAAEAKELLEGKQRDFALEEHQFRQFLLHSVPFVVRLNNGATDVGTCDQLWPLGAHRDNTRLCMYFNTIEDKQRFDQIAGRLNFDSRVLALKLAMDFMAKFPK
jgi:hypothetical protein